MGGETILNCGFPCWYHVTYSMSEKTRFKAVIWSLVNFCTFICFQSIQNKEKWENDTWRWNRFHPWNISHIHLESCCNVAKLKEREWNLDHLWFHSSMSCDVGKSTLWERVLWEVFLHNPLCGKVYGLRWWTEGWNYRCFFSPSWHQSQSSCSWCCGRDKWMAITL